MRSKNIPMNINASPDPATPPAPEASLSCVAALIRFHGVAADAANLRHQLGTGAPTTEALVRLVRRLGLKARFIQSSRERLLKTRLPALARARDGEYFIVGRCDAVQVLVQTDLSKPPTLLIWADFEMLWAGGLLLVTRRASLSDLGREFGIGWFARAMWKYRPILRDVLIASFFLQLFGLISPLFFQVVVDKVLVHRGLSTLDVLIIGLAAISIFETVLGGLRTYVFAHTTNRIDVELGARLFRHLISLPIGYFQSRRVGDSVARVRELENIRQFITSSALTLVVDLVFTIVFLAVMAWYSIWLCLIVIASLPLYAAISMIAAPIFRARLDEKFRRGAENQAFLVETVTGIETLKSMAVEPQMQNRWEEQLAGYVKASFSVTSLGNTASQSIQLVSKLVSAVILFFGAHAVMAGDLTIGELVAFNMLQGRVAQPVLRLAQLWQDFHQARLSIQRLGDILNTPAEPAMTGGRAALPPIKGHIRFDRVVFRYRLDGPEILKGIDLEIAHGQSVGIVGSSGSGKSTLTKLVQRLYSPESGRVLIDGTDLTLVDASWLRRQVGVVLQESVLFNRSVRDNIALSDSAMAM